MIVLDTHVWVRWLEGRTDPLPASVVQCVEESEHLGVSVVSWWEVAMLAKRGRLALPLSIEDWCHEATTGSGIATLPLTSGIALRAVQLQDVHRDPADRFIIATALVHGAKLLTLDGAILAYPEAQDMLVRS